MRFLLDMNLPPSLCGTLTTMDHAAVHVAAIGLAAATDEAIVVAARERTETIITNDLDFTRILAVDGLSRPSLVLLRLGNASTGHLGAALKQHLPSICQALDRGAIVVIEDHSLRIRYLPVGRLAD